RHHGPGGLVVRPIERGARLPIQAVVFDVLCNADDGEPRYRRIEPAQLDAFSNGVFIRPVPFGHRLIDDNNAGRTCRITLRKFTSADQLDPHRPKIVWADDAVTGIGLVFRPRIRLTLYDEASARIAASDRQVADGADCHYPRNAPDLFL